MVAGPFLLWLRGTFVFFLILEWSLVAAQRDIVFILDRSESVSAEEFSHAVSMTYDAIQRLDIGPNDNLVAMVTYSEDVKSEFNFTLTDKVSLLAAVRLVTLEKPGGETRTHDAIKFAREVVFQTGTGSRPDAIDTVVLLTDGVSYIPYAIRESSALKDTGAAIFTIGIGEAVEDGLEELEAISSDPNSWYMFTVGNYTTLASLVPLLAQRLKQVPEIPIEIEIEVEEEIDVAVTAGIIVGVIVLFAVVALIIYLINKRIHKKENVRKDTVGEAIGPNAPHPEDALDCRPPGSGHKASLGYSPERPQVLYDPAKPFSSDQEKFYGGQTRTDFHSGLDPGTSADGGCKTDLYGPGSIHDANKKRNRKSRPEVNIVDDVKNTLVSQGLDLEPATKERLDHRYCHDNEFKPIRRQSKVHPYNTKPFEDGQPLDKSDKTSDVKPPGNDSVPRHAGLLNPSEHENSDGQQQTNSSSPSSVIALKLRKEMKLREEGWQDPTSPTPKQTTGLSMGSRAVFHVVH